MTEKKSLSDLVSEFNVNLINYPCRIFGCRELLYGGCRSVNGVNLKTIKYIDILEITAAI